MDSVFILIHWVHTTPFILVWFISFTRVRWVPLPLHNQKIGDLFYFRKYPHYPCFFHNYQQKGFSPGPKILSHRLAHAQPTGCATRKTFWEYATPCQNMDMHLNRTHHLLFLFYAKIQKIYQLTKTFFKLFFCHFLVLLSWVSLPDSSLSPLSFLSLLLHTH